MFVSFIILNHVDYCHVLLLYIFFNLKKKLILSFCWSPEEEDQKEEEEEEEEEEGPIENIL